MSRSEQLATSVLPQYLDIRSFGCSLLVAPHEQIRKPNVAHAPAHPACLLGNTACKVVFLVPVQASITTLAAESVNWQVPASRISTPFILTTLVSHPVHYGVRKVTWGMRP